MKKYLFFLVFFSIVGELMAQVDTTMLSVIPKDSAIKDSLAHRKLKLPNFVKEIITKDKKGEHSPLKACVYSAILPGGGQLYNRRYWKIPIVYAGLGAAGYWYYKSDEKYKQFKQAYIYAVDGISTTSPLSVFNESDQNIYNTATADGFKLYRDTHRKRREQAGFVLFFTYTLNIVDAFVDAHLFSFDINDDLTLEWQPQMQWQGSQMASGIGLRLLPRTSPKKQKISFDF